ncbi:hypothetical protein, partial [Pseudomarimonas arenosa]|uniref:hypothetical protein n=1 Tax=Pseudomarimonas arenosa TaxID=2774145 RepID=UPI001CDBEBA3
MPAPKDREHSVISTPSVETLALLIPTLQPNKHPAFGHFSIVVVNRRCDGNSVSGISQENAAG